MVTVGDGDLTVMLALLALLLPGCCDGGLGTCPPTDCAETTESCRLACDEQNARCAGLSPEELGGFDEALGQWRQRAADREQACDKRFPLMVVGECSADARRVLFEHGGFTGRALIYDADTGEFVGYLTYSDVIDCACQGRKYWPRLEHCSDGAVTEVLCGATLSVGDELTFP